MVWSSAKFSHQAFTRVKNSLFAHTGRAREVEWIADDMRLSLDAGRRLLIYDRAAVFRENLVGCFRIRQAKEADGFHGVGFLVDADADSGECGIHLTLGHSSDGIVQIGKPDLNYVAWLYAAHFHSGHLPGMGDGMTSEV